MHAVGKAKTRSRSVRKRKFNKVRSSRGELYLYYNLFYNLKKTIQIILKPLNLYEQSYHFCCFFP